MSFGEWRPYVSVAERRRNAAKEVAKLAKKGRVITPVRIEGRAIAQTFWGKSWCENLESYSDYANRLPRGRTYVRNGSVVDLQIRPGRIEALVSGSEIYEIEIDIARLDAKRWKQVVAECAGKIDSVVSLLRGKLSPGALEVIAKPQSGLFPTPRDIKMNCSCPDWAGLCKHLAAVLYGVGARLDAEPALFFTLRQVDENDLIGAGASGLSGKAKKPGTKRIAVSDLSSVFGIEIEVAPKKTPKKTVTAKKAVQPKRAAQPKTIAARRGVRKKPSSK